MTKPRMIDVDEEIVPKVPEKKVEEMLTDNFLEIKDLPSRFKLYPEGTRIFGRPMKLSEVKKLTFMNEDNYNDLMRYVLSSCIKGIDIDDIYIADKLYLIFWLRANTYKDANFITSYICEHCGKKTEYKFDVGNFEINYLDDDFELKALKLLNRDTVIEFDLPRIRDEENIRKFQDVLKNGVVKYDDDTITMAGMIKSIDGQSVSIRKACEFISSLENEPENYAYITSYVLSLDFGIVPVINATCHHVDCKKVNQIPISFRPDFFIPKYKF